MKDHDAKSLFERMRNFTRDNKVAIITAKAKPMTERELTLCNQPNIIDYIGILK